MPQFKIKSLGEKTYAYEALVRMPAPGGYPSARPGDVINVYQDHIETVSGGWISHGGTFDVKRYERLEQPALVTRICYQKVQDDLPTAP